MRIDLRYTKLFGGSISGMIPNSTRASLLLKDVDSVEMSLCKQMPEPSSAYAIWLRMETTHYFAVAMPAGPPPMIAMLRML